MVACELFANVDDTGGTAFPFIKHNVCFFCLTVFEYVVLSCAIGIAWPVVVKFAEDFRFFVLLYAEPFERICFVLDFFIYL